jgi:hypothetical protein
MNVSVTKLRHRLANSLLQVTLRNEPIFCSIGYDALSEAISESSKEHIVSLVDSPLLTDHWSLILEKSKTMDMSKHLAYLSEIIGVSGSPLLTHFSSNSSI